VCGLRSIEDLVQRLELTSGVIEQREITILNDALHDTDRTVSQMPDSEIDQSFRRARLELEVLPDYELALQEYSAFIGAMNCFPELLEQARNDITEATRQGLAHLRKTRKTYSRMVAKNDLQETAINAAISRIDEIKPRMQAVYEDPSSLEASEDRVRHRQRNLVDSAFALSDGLTQMLDHQTYRSFLKVGLIQEGLGVINDSELVVEEYLTNLFAFRNLPEEMFRYARDKVIERLDSELFALEGYKLSYQEHEDAPDLLIKNAILDTQKRIYERETLLRSAIQAVRSQEFLDYKLPEKIKKPVVRTDTVSNVPLEKVVVETYSHEGQSYFDTRAIASILQVSEVTIKRGLNATSDAQMDKYIAEGSVKKAIAARQGASVNVYREDIIWNLVFGSPSIKTRRPTLEKARLAHKAMDQRVIKEHLPDNFYLLVAPHAKPNVVKGWMLGEKKAISLSKVSAISNIPIPKLNQTLTEAIEANPELVQDSVAMINDKRGRLMIAVEAIPSIFQLEKFTLEAYQTIFAPYDENKIAPRERALELILQKDTVPEPKKVELRGFELEGQRYAYVNDLENALGIGSRALNQRLRTEKGAALVENGIVIRAQSGSRSVALVNWDAMFSALSQKQKLLLPREVYEQFTFVPTAPKALAHPFKGGPEKVLPPLAKDLEREVYGRNILRVKGKVIEGERYIYCSELSRALGNVSSAIGTRLKQQPERYQKLKDENYLVDAQHIRGPSPLVHWDGILSVLSSRQRQTFSAEIFANLEFIEDHTKREILNPPTGKPRPIRVPTAAELGVTYKLESAVKEAKKENSFLIAQEQYCTIDSAIMAFAIPKEEKASFREKVSNLESRNIVCAETIYFDTAVYRLSEMAELSGKSLETVSADFSSRTANTFQVGRPTRLVRGIVDEENQYLSLSVLSRILNRPIDELENKFYEKAVANSELITERDFLIADIEQEREKYVKRSRVKELLDAETFEDRLQLFNVIYADTATVLPASMASREMGMRIREDKTVVVEAGLELQTYPSRENTYVLVNDLPEILGLASERIELAFSKIRKPFRKKCEREAWLKNILTGASFEDTQKAVRLDRIIEVLYENRSIRGDETKALEIASANLQTLEERHKVLKARGDTYVFVDTKSSKFKCGQIIDNRQYLSSDSIAEIARKEVGEVNLAIQSLASSSKELVESGAIRASEEGQLYVAMPEITKVLPHLRLEREMERWIYIYAPEKATNAKSLEETATQFTGIRSEEQKEENNQIRVYVKNGEEFVDLNDASKIISTDHTTIRAAYDSDSADAKVIYNALTGRKVTVVKIQSLLGVVEKQTRYDQKRYEARTSFEDYKDNLTEIIAEECSYSFVENNEIVARGFRTKQGDHLGPSTLSKCVEGYSAYKIQGLILALVKESPKLLLEGKVILRDDGAALIRTDSTDLLELEIDSNARFAFIPDSDKRFLSCKEACEKLDVDYQTLIRTTQIPVQVLEYAKTRWFRPEDFNQAIDGNEALYVLDENGIGILLSENTVKNSQLAKSPDATLEELVEAEGVCFEKMHKAPLCLSSRRVKVNQDKIYTVAEILDLFEVSDYHSELLTKYITSSSDRKRFFESEGVIKGFNLPRALEGMAECFEVVQMPNSVNFERRTYVSMNLLQRISGNASLEQDNLPYFQHNDSSSIIYCGQRYVDSGSVKMVIGRKQYKGLTSRSLNTLSSAIDNPERVATLS
jgi:hypothetical protein